MSNGCLQQDAPSILVIKCPNNSIPRANPYAEGTNPICRLPLLTLL